MREAEFQPINRRTSNCTFTARSDEKKRLLEENAEMLLDRAINLYGISLRDYFAAFSTYTTATSILVAAIGFLAKEKQSPQLIFVVASCGMLVCWQWYISTASMRDQYSFFKKRITYLEGKVTAQEGAELLMTRWLQCAGEARRGTRLDKIENPERKKDVAQLNFNFSSLNSFWGMRGTMLPVIYSAVFFAVMIWVVTNAILSAPPLSPLMARYLLNPIAGWVAPDSIGSWLALIAAIVWLLSLVGSIHRRGKQLRAHPLRKQKETD